MVRIATYSVIALILAFLMGSAVDGGLIVATEQYKGLPLGAPPAANPAGEMIDQPTATDAIFETTLPTGQLLDWKNPMETPTELAAEGFGVAELGRVINGTTALSWPHDFSRGVFEWDRLSLWTTIEPTSLPAQTFPVAEGFSVDSPALWFDVAFESTGNAAGHSWPPIGLAEGGDDMQLHVTDIDQTSVAAFRSIPYPYLNSPWQNDMPTRAPQDSMPRDAMLNLTASELVRRTIRDSDENYTPNSNKDEPPSRQHAGSSGT
jgi:hypothetical protein